MEYQEFIDYIQKNITGKLPSDFKDAKVQYKKVTKSNDQMLTGLLIKQNDESMAPIIYLDSYYDMYQNGIQIDEVMHHLTKDYLLAREGTIPAMNDEVEKIYDFSQIKGQINIRMCDYNLNQERLKDLAYTMHGDFAATYQVVLKEENSQTASVAVTNSLLQHWNMPVEKLHQEVMAIQADNCQPSLQNLDDVMAALFDDRNRNSNLLVNNEPVEIESYNVPLFVFTNGSGINGASAILHDDWMDKASKAMGGNFFVLPSSVHEVMILPDTGIIELEELSDMVKNINRTAVTPDDLLSDHVQYYDCIKKELKNAVEVKGEKENISAAKEKENLADQPEKSNRKTLR